MYVSDCNQELDIAFILHSSPRDSATEELGTAFNKSLQFVRDVLSHLDFTSGKTRAALITFNSWAHVRFGLDSFSNRDAIYSALESIPLGEGNATFTSEAIRLAREDVFDPQRGDRSTALNVAVIVTDQVHQYSCVYFNILYSYLPKIYIIVMSKWIYSAGEFTTRNNNKIKCLVNTRLK